MQFGYRCLKRHSGRTFLLAPVSTLTQSEAIPLLLAEAGRWTVVHMSFVWGAWTSSRKISSHGGSSRWTPTGSAFFPFLPHWKCVPFNWLSTGAVDGPFLLEQHLACQWPFLNNPCRQILQQGNCHIQVDAGMYNSGTVRIASVVASKGDGTSGLHWWFCQYTLQWLQTQWHSMHGRSPVDVKHPYHIWPWEVPSIAQCHHLEWHESPCPWPETQQLYHSHHLLVYGEHSNHRLGEAHLLEPEK